MPNFISNFFKKHLTQWHHFYGELWKDSQQSGYKLGERMARRKKPLNDSTENNDNGRSNSAAADDTATGK